MDQHLPRPPADQEARRNPYAVSYTHLGKKPFRQKGTGNARQGSIRAPHFTGGGIVHGPQPRDYSQRTPKKMKVGALRSALSDRARNGRIHVVTALFEGEKPSTKQALAAVRALVADRPALVVLERGDELTALSLRNACLLYTSESGRFQAQKAKSLKANVAPYMRPQRPQEVLR